MKELIMYTHLIKRGIKGEANVVAETRGKFNTRLFFITFVAGSVCIVYIYFVVIQFILGASLDTYFGLGGVRRTSRSHTDRNNVNAGYIHTYIWYI